MFYSIALLAGRARIFRAARVLWLPLVGFSMISACGGNSDPSVQAATGRVAAAGAGTQIITAWKAAPSDALITHPITGLTVRQAFSPLWSGKTVRLRLSNRYSSAPVTLENVTLAQEAKPGAAEMIQGTMQVLTFGGKKRVTIPAGESIVSDWAQYPVAAFRRIGVSFFAPDFTPQLTRHLNSNEVLYLSVPGDYTADPSGSKFQPSPEGYTANFLIIEALEMIAPRSVSTLVAVGDSITDGSDSTTGFADGKGSPMIATDQRYPDHLQRRFNQAGLPLAVANAGIGGNELLRDGWLPQFGPALLKRLDVDVLQAAGVSHVLLMIGTNDFGNPKLGTPPTSEEVIAGYKWVIKRIHDAGIRVVLGTIPPAEGAVTHDLPWIGELPVTIPVMHGTAQARRGRDEVNEWIKTQTLSDGVVDFAACLEDPERPGYLAPEYNSGDNLHPNPAGYAAMANCVDLRLFTQSEKTK